MSLRGTVAKTSRATDVMIGVIMIARIKPAVKKDRPVCVPSNSRVSIGIPLRASDTELYTPLMLGASTRMPHRPNTTDGTPASRSITEFTTTRSRAGATSVTNRAMPTLTGRAKRTAMDEMTAVP